MIYAYLRVSTIIQDEENQRLGVDSKAKQLNLTIDRYVIDHVSGTKDINERNLGKLLKRVKKDDVIIISEISRLARRIYLLFRILEILLNKGVKVYSVKEGYTLDGSIQSKVVAFAFGMAAEIERDMISKRTKEALDLRRKMGVKLGRPKGAKTKKHRLDAYAHKIKRWRKDNVSYTKMARRCACTPKTIKKYIARTSI